MAEDFEYAIKKELEGLTVKQTQLFAWRCAARALPFLGYQGSFDFWEEKDRQRYLGNVFYALDACYFTAYAKATAFASARAAMSAADAAFTSSRVNARTAAIAADAAAIAISKSNITPTADLWQVIYDDIQAMKKGIPSNISTNWYGAIWDNFLMALNRIGCGYWGELYQNLFDNNFEQDMETVRTRVNLPEEIRKQGAKATADALVKMEAGGAENLNESRILILGDKGVGKTCVTRKLANPKAKMTTSDESTAGVDTLLWPLPKAETNVRIWDFAGHTVTHSAHQFFLSERCLYIIVFDGRTEGGNRWTYWLDQMLNYGGDSQAIILVNQRDTHRVEVPVNMLREKYNIAGVYSFNVDSDKKQLAEFRKAVAEIIKGNPSWNQQMVPKEYYQVKTALEKEFDQSKSRETRNSSPKSGLKPSPARLMSRRRVR